MRQILGRHEVVGWAAVSDLASLVPQTHGADEFQRIAQVGRTVLGQQAEIADLGQALAQLEAGEVIAGYQKLLDLREAAAPIPPARA